MSADGKMTVGIVGLGLIGGSFARAYKAAGHTVFGHDRDGSVEQFAELSSVLDGPLTDENLKECDTVIVALYPDATADFIKSKGPRLKGKLVIDCCGTKRDVCKVGFAEAEKNGFTFVGGHPMAGTHFSGFKYSDAGLFRGAPFVIVPPVFDDIELLDRVKRALEPAGFGSFSVTGPEEHDRMIAFTSQMAHVISGAFIKSPTATSHKGFSAGSYRDMTRVAWLNPEMWADLFLENGDNLVFELDTFMNELEKYRDAIKDGDRARLVGLLEEGKRRKEEVDGK